MTESSMSLDYRLSELRQVASELRSQRHAQGASDKPTRRPGRIRVAAGRAFLAIASALLAEPKRTIAVH